MAVFGVGMIQKRDSDFYKLKHPFEKLCYLQGMPKQFIKGHEKELEFMGFRGNAKSITPALQKKAFEDLKANNMGASHTAFWLSNPHDRPALEAACLVLRKQAERGFKSFEFISPFEDLRFSHKEDGSDIRQLYVLLGAHPKDVEMTHRIRRWLRQPHGASVWVVGVADDPYKWASQEVGCVPDFMFWFKKSGMPMG